MVIMAALRSVLLLFLFPNFFTVNFSEQIPGCDESSNGTGCLLGEEGNTNSCTDFKERLFTLPEKNYLLKIHSTLRENMTKGTVEKLPKAFYMKALYWNETLARMAQDWADKCTSKKDPNLQLGGKPVGQFIIAAEEGSRKASLKDLLGKWTAGVNSLNEEIISKYRKPNAGDFDYEPVAQMIWWNTSQVGCGRSSFRSYECRTSKAKNCSKIVVQLVCNYFPKGNMEGEAIYFTSKDNTLICQYDDQQLHCRDLVGKKRAEADDYDDWQYRFRNKLLEHLKNSGCQPSLGDPLYLYRLYFLIFFTYLFTLGLFIK